jgi:hypothetical protein
MVLLLGIALAVLALVAFFLSLPRGGKTARFVGSEWEPYAVVAFICAFFVGLLLAISDVLT